MYICIRMANKRVQKTKTAIASFSIFLSHSSVVLVWA